MKRDKFAIVALFVLIALILAMIVTVVMGAPSDNSWKINSTGNETLVLKIINLTPNHYYAIPAYYVHVVHSNDTAIEEGVNYYLEIDIYATYHFWAEWLTPKEFAKGPVIGIDYYNVTNINRTRNFNSLYYCNGSTITVSVEADYLDKIAWENAWRQKIRVIG